MIAAGAFVLTGIFKRMLIKLLREECIIASLAYINATALSAVAVLSGLAASFLTIPALHNKAMQRNTNILSHHIFLLT